MEEQELNQRSEDRERNLPPDRIIVKNKLPRKRICLMEVEKFVESQLFLHKMAISNRERTELIKNCYFEETKKKHESP